MSQDQPTKSLRLAAASRLAPSRIRAIAALADERPGTLRLFVGEDTRPTPAFIKDAAHAAIVADKTYYTPNVGYVEVCRGVADHLRMLHGVEIDPTSQIVVTSSGMNAIVLACQATVGPGNSALVLSPLWPNTANAVRVTGAEAIEVPLDFAESGYSLDFDRLESSRHSPGYATVSARQPRQPDGLDGDGRGLGADRRLLRAA